MISCHIFSAQYPKRYRKSARCEPFKAEHPKRYQTAFLPLESKTSTLVLFSWEFPQEQLEAKERKIICLKEFGGLPSLRHIKSVVIVFFFFYWGKNDNDDDDDDNDDDDVLFQLILWPVAYC